MFIYKRIETNISVLKTSTFELVERTPLYTNLLLKLDIRYSSHYKRFNLRFVHRSSSTSSATSWSSLSFAPLLDYPWPTPSQTPNRNPRTTLLRRKVKKNNLLHIMYYFYLAKSSSNRMTDLMSSFKKVSHLRDQNSACQ